MTSRKHLRNQTERTIASARVVLAATGLFALWLDPADPARFLGLTYSVHSGYLVYSALLAGLVWNRSAAGRLPLVTHVVDVVIFSVFQFLTLGPSSPFFVYFIFSLFCGALRWQWRGTLGTALLVVPSYLVMAVSMERTVGPGTFETNRFIIRMVYLAGTAALLVYLGQHETRLRGEIQRLARWPQATGPDAQTALSRVIEHAVEILGATHAVVAWEASDEPWLHVAARTPTEVTVSKHRPGELDPVVPPPLAPATIVTTTRLSNSGVSLINRGDATWEWHGLPLHTGLLPRLGGLGLTSAPFRTEQISGRVFFSGLGEGAGEMMSLTEVVAREIGTSIDQLHTTEQLKEIAASEQRLRLARDLHDGVLQSLTGIRFELATVASSLDREPVPATRERLLTLERAMAIEQRELRLFIDSLRPVTAEELEYGGLGTRLSDMRRRLELEWKTPISLATRPRSMPLTEELEHAVMFMTHEAVINALKHAHPSRISVDVTLEADTLTITVRDDGRGFAFKGRYDHDELVAAHLGPVSLRERAESLGGRMSIESTDIGSRVEIALPAGEA